VAIDLVGSFTEALDGSLYGLVIHDLFSHMTSTFGLKRKADAPQSVMDWLVEFEKHTGHVVLWVRSNNAGEFSSNRFNKFLSECNIRHEMSVPYEHHQKRQCEAYKEDSFGHGKDNSGSTLIACSTVVSCLKTRHFHFQLTSS
jgi:hypothetical protein